jgi:septal ring factor EnvC (AmiA/AmiB activator)
VEAEREAALKAAAEKEQERVADEERHAREVEAERKAKEAEAERKAKEEEEKRRRAEEEKRRLQEAEDKRRAEEEAKRKNAGGTPTQTGKGALIQIIGALLFVFGWVLFGWTWWNGNIFRGFCLMESATGEDCRVFIDSWVLGGLMIVGIYLGEHLFTSGKDI